MFKRKIEAEYISKFSINSKFNKYLNIGQVPISEKFFYSKNKNMEPGRFSNVTDFNVWKRVLSYHEMKNWTQCVNTSYGDVVNWNEINWDVISMYQKEANHSMICGGNENTIRIQSELTFPDSQLRSKVLRGKYLVMLDNQTQNKVLNMIERKHVKCRNSK